MVYVDEDARKKRSFTGRPRVPEAKKDLIVTEYNRGELSARKIATKYNISTPTLYRIIKERSVPLHEPQDENTR